MTVTSTLPRPWRWLQGAVLLSAATLSLGVTQAQDSPSDSVSEKIKAAVAAGKISAEEGQAKWAAYLRGLKTKPAAGAKTKADLDELGQQLKAAVAAGKLSQAEALAKWNKAAGAKKRRAARGKAPFLPSTATAPEPDGGLTTPTEAASLEGSASSFIFGWAANATHRFVDDSHHGEPISIRGLSFRLDPRAHGRDPTPPYRSRGSLAGSTRRNLIA